MTAPATRPWRVLFVCTGNSARSQIAEALLNAMGQGRFVGGSAGSHPAAGVNPFALETLKEHGIPAAGHAPHGLDAVEHEAWDFIITVCDRARESCPIFPGQPVVAHWGLPDPADVEGPDDVKRTAFRDTFLALRARIGLFLALPLDRLDRLARQAQVQALGKAPA